MTSRFASARLIRTLAIVAAIATPCAGFAACGLDENGILPPVDGAPPIDVITPPDSGIDSPDVVVDNYIPPACSTLDASCLGAAIPDGWVPIGLVENLTTPCPGDASDFAQTDWGANAKIHTGACSCGICATSGSWTCGGSVSVDSNGGNTCTGGTNDTFPAGPHCTTSVNSSGANEISGSLPTVGGSVNCSSSVVGNGQVDTTSARTCKPLQCTTDYCGLANQGFRLCVLYNGTTTCPGAFPTGLTSGSHQIDVPQDTQVSCNTCQCTVVSEAGTSCTATLRTFSSTDCDGDGGTNGPNYMNSYDAAGINNCLPVGSSSMHSVFYLPGNPPGTQCNTTTPNGSGTASFKTPLTVCCK